MLDNIFIKFFFLIPFSLFLCGAATAVPATVDYILDGDTFAARVMLENEIQISVRVRIINIDTPEMRGACESEIAAAGRAKDRLSELLPTDSVVELSNIKDDKYLGRIDANVKTPSGADVSTILIREGHARKYNGGKRKGWCG